MLVILFLLSFTFIMTNNVQAVAPPTIQSKVQAFVPYKFIAYGDTRNTPTGDNTGIEKTSAMIEDVMAEHDIEFILHVGDMVDSGGSQSEYDNYWWPHMSDIVTQVPFYASAGNHEYVPLSGPDDVELSIFRSNVVNLNNSPYSEQFFSFDVPNGDTHVIVLNGGYYFDHGMNLTLQTEQIAWLEADLNATTTTRIVVMNHYPFFGSTSARIGEREIIRDAWLDLLLDYDVDFVIGGHDHQVVHQVRNETDFLVAGAGTAAYTYPTPPGGLGDEWQDGDYAVGGIYAICLVEATSAGFDVDVIVDNGSVIYEFFVDAAIVDEDAPVISSPADLSFVEGTAGQTITWTVNDVFTGTYSISIDGVEDDSGSWTQGESIVYDVSAFTVGTYEVELEATDTSTNSASDAVTVTVTAEEITTTTTTGTSPGMELLAGLVSLIAGVYIFSNKRRK
jgi:predicted phosphodiesterase